MGEILLEALAEIVGAFIKFLFSPKVMESLPKPIRIFIRFMTILIVISLLGLILFAGFFALYSFIRKGASVLVLIGGINDFHYCPRDAASFGAAVDMTLAAIAAKYPNAQIVAVFDGNDT